MYTLSNDAVGNDALTISILDPIADRERFGVRYCTGGYIYQIADARLGALLSGPTYPDSFNWFDGQGIPDAFNLSPLRDPASADPASLVIGIGLCDLPGKRVVEFCQWQVEQRAGEIVMRTSHAYAGYALELERTVRLLNRSVRSATRVLNTGRQPIPLRWFPHPFFPQPQTNELCRFNIPVGMPENAGYALLANGWIARKGWPWAEGHYQALDHAAQANLVIQQRHPQLGMLSATTSYIPALFPIWGNRYTFSWEPFLERTAAAGQELSWWIDYDF
jgi:hypothetical protein